MEQAVGTTGYGSELGRYLFRRLAWIIGIIVFMAAGWLIPRLLIDDGVDRFDDPAARTVAWQAHDLAWAVCMQNPLMQLPFPAIKVTEVTREPGNCTDHVTPGNRYGGYRATIRVYGWYGVPLHSFHATCGGDAIRCHGRG